MDCLTEVLESAVGFFKKLVSTAVVVFFPMGLFGRFHQL
jgi:hypothetical protein